jgi:hypothetical protein
MPRGRQPRATRRDDRSPARQHSSCPWGPQPPQPHTRLSPAARLSARGRERPGRLTAPASPAGLGPVLDPPARSSGSAAAGETGQTTAPGRHTRPAGQSSMPATARNTDKRPVKPRLTRPRSFRDDTEEITGSNPVRPTPFFENLASAGSRDGSHAPAVLPNKRWSQRRHSGLCISRPGGSGQLGALSHGRYRMRQPSRHPGHHVRSVQHAA